MAREIAKTYEPNQIESREMLQAVTSEILKPVVAAMIRDEINAKKP
jgi:hypothetical protein